MIIAFTLSMPNRSSWNGGWSGDDSLFVKTISKQTKEFIEKAKKLIERGNFYYNFGDGWRACVSIKEVDRSEASKLRRKSKGFSGYDWMIRSILDNGEIIPESRK